MYYFGLFAQGVYRNHILAKGNFSVLNKNWEILIETRAESHVGQNTVVFCFAFTLVSAGIWFGKCLHS